MGEQAMQNISLLGLNSSIASNQTGVNGTSLSKSGARIDCAKECPCGASAIPVPDQWLEVMVTGKFKVWHIIFIIIALVVTLIVVYCCFHRVRIPRTKQEIEADLMRSTLTTKFREYLQDFPNEPTTFLEALKKVQDLEEKLEKDDEAMSREAGLRKRKGWLKLKGKPSDKNPEEQTETEGQEGSQTNVVSAATVQKAEPVNLMALATSAGEMLRNEQMEKMRSKRNTSLDKIEKPNGVDLAATGDANTPEPDDVGAKSKIILAARSRAKTRQARHDKSAVIETNDGQTTHPKHLEASGVISKTHSKEASAKRRKEKPNLARSKKLARDKSQPSIEAPLADIDKKASDTKANSTSHQHQQRPDEAQLESVLIKDSSQAEADKPTSTKAHKTKKSKPKDEKSKRSTSKTKTKASQGDQLKVVVVGR